VVKLENKAWRFWPSRSRIPPLVASTKYRVEGDSAALRFAGAPALFEYHAGRICGIRDVAGCHGPLRHAVLPCDAEHSRHWCAGGIGARPGDIIRLVVRQGMELAAIGILAGLAGAAVLTRVMASMLFGVDIAMRPNIRNSLSELVQLSAA